MHEGAVCPTPAVSALALICTRLSRLRARAVWVTWIRAALVNVSFTVITRVTHIAGAGVSVQQVGADAVLTGTGPISEIAVIVDINVAVFAPPVGNATAPIAVQLRHAATAAVLTRIFGTLIRVYATVATFITRCTHTRIRQKQVSAVSMHTRAGPISKIALVDSLTSLGLETYDHWVVAASPSNRPLRGSTRDDIPTAITHAPVPTAPPVTVQIRDIDHVSTKRKGEVLCIVAVVLVLTGHGWVRCETIRVHI